MKAIDAEGLDPYRKRVSPERLRDTPLALTGQAAALIAVVIGMILVSRSKALGHGTVLHDCAAICAA